MLPHNWTYSSINAGTAGKVMWPSATDRRYNRLMIASRSIDGPSDSGGLSSTRTLYTLPVTTRRAPEIRQVLQRPRRRFFNSAYSSSVRSPSSRSRVISRILAATPVTTTRGVPGDGRRSRSSSP